MRFGTKTGTNNVNICINVNKGSGESVNYLQDKITALTSDLNILRENISGLTSIERFGENLNSYLNVDELEFDLNSIKENLSGLISIESFEEKLNNFLNFDELEKVKYLISGQTFETLKNYTEKYNDFISLLEDNSKIEYKETDVYLAEFNSLSSVLIRAQVDGEWIQLNDLENSDYDDDTIYKIPIQGFVLAAEMYCSNYDTNARERLEDAKTTYDSISKTSYIYLNHEDYRIIYDRAPNNKLKVYSLIIK